MMEYCHLIPLAFGVKPTLPHPFPAPEPSLVNTERPCISVLGFCNRAPYLKEVQVGGMEIWTSLIGSHHSTPMGEEV